MKINIHTKPSSKPVKNLLVDHSKSQDSLTLKIATPWLTPLPEDQSQLPLMLLTGQDINQVSSTTVKLPLTTVSFWSVSQLMLGKSRTLGEPHGEKVDSLELPEETPVVSVTSPHTQTNDLNRFTFVFVFFYLF